jgi:hypothetical protein
MTLALSSSISLVLAWLSARGSLLSSAAQNIDDGRRELPLAHTHNGGYDMGDEEAKRTSSNKNPTAPRMSTRSCRFSSFDIFVVATAADFPLLSFLMRSIDLFMPCYNTLHLLLDDGDIPKVLAWIPAGPQSHLRIHPLRYSDAVAHLSGYTLQAYVMLWADNYTQSTGAEYVMFLDTDSVLALPVTCSSLFDEQGRQYLVSWPIEVQNLLQEDCDYFFSVNATGVPQHIEFCRESFMTTFPITVPVHVFSSLRTHMTKQLQRDPALHNARISSEPYFDRDMAAYFHAKAAADKPDVFAQFQVIGEYLRVMRPDLVHVVFCPFLGDLKNHTGTFCTRYAAPGVHYAWR